MASQAARRILSASVIIIPPSIYFNDTFYSTLKVHGNTMEPALQDGDIVLVRKIDFLPYYFQEKLSLNDLQDDASYKLEQEADRLKSLRMDASVGRPAGDEFTLWRSPPNALPGDVIAFTSPKAMECIDVKRIIGLGGQRIRPKSHYHKIEHIQPYSVWVEGDNGSDGYNGSVVKKLVIGKIDRIVWPPSRWGKVLGLRPPIGRAWWP